MDEALKAYQQANASDVARDASARVERERTAARDGAFVFERG